MNKLLISLVILSIILISFTLNIILKNNNNLNANSNNIYINIPICVNKLDNKIATELYPLNVTLVSSFLNCALIVASDGYLSKKPLEIFYDLSNLTSTSNGYVFIILFANSFRQNFLTAFLKALTKNGYKMPLLIANSTIDKKVINLDSRLFNSDVIAISFKPFGWSIADKISSPANDVAWAINNFLDSKYQLISQKTSVQDGITVNGFNFIGYVGWKTANAVDNNGKVVGIESIKVDYYYTSATTANGKYEFFLAHIWHSAYGNLCWTAWYGVTYCYAPKSWVSVTNWETSTWPGQVLDDWGPKNTGSNTIITYSISASATVGSSGPSVSAGATVSYTIPGGLVINWQDYTQPQNGYVQTNHQIPNSQGGQPGPVYTLEPASIGFLDPTKPGGIEPMSVFHDFKVIFDDGDGDLWNADINFYVTLYSTYVSG